MREALNSAIILSPYSLCVDRASVGLSLSVLNLFPDSNRPKSSCIKQSFLALGVIGSATVLALVIVGLFFAARGHHGAAIRKPSKVASGNNNNNALFKSPSGEEEEIPWQEPPEPKPSPKEYKFKLAAVASDSSECSTVGKQLLLQGGNAVDAAIGALACLGLTDPQSMGLGGGFFMTIYNATTGNGTIIDARETAPEKATVNMFEGNPHLSSSGPLSIAVPAELKGYWHAHKKYGRLRWSVLFKAAIKMAEEGFPVPIGLHHAIQDAADLLTSEPSLREVFFNKETGQLFRYQEIMRRPRLAKTLQHIASEGLIAFYISTVFKNMMADLEEIGKHIHYYYSAECPVHQHLFKNMRADLEEIEALVSGRDILTYEVLEKEPLEITLDDTLRVMSPPAPSGGPVLSFMLNIMEGYKLQPKDVATLEAKVLTYHRIIESFKFGYAKRTALGDEDFVNITELVANLTSKAYADSIRQLITDNVTHDYHYYGPSFYTPKTSGTSHLSVLDQDGNAVAVTSTINGRFGAGLRGRRTGIIWNNEMDDFSAPNITNEYGLLPTEANFIKPGKRPLSSMCPTITVKSGGAEGRDQVQQIIGAAGGSKITTTVAWTAEHNLWLGKSIKESVDMYRLHHQLLPPQLQYEEGSDELVLQGLKEKGHELLQFSLGESVSQGIEVKDGEIFAASDYRKGGTPDGF
ncbi:gamma-glutamyltranspeptidase 1 [Plakobranchus ocellatus]|uniref:Gamma-glutamyltranspeptidase 1 n=1 Tax=Plakobranchus ocellatus TaxID=259542 RepID=A0AAV3Z9R2_9GAST|nr:gamma-glutamyltranspeptidase 1 [Plakobranchus ocellatus]